MTDKSIYRIVFHNQGNVYELYAREISQSAMYAFVEVGDIISVSYTHLTLPTIYSV